MPPAPRAASGRSGAGRRRRGSAGASAIDVGARGRRRRARGGAAGRAVSPLVDVQPDELVLVVRRLAHERLAARRGRGPAARSPSTPMRHDVAGDLALELVGGALGDDPAVVDDREPVGTGRRPPRGSGSSGRRSSRARAGRGSRPTSGPGPADRGRSSARRGTARAGGGRCRARRRAGGACRRSRCRSAGPRPPRGRGAARTSAARACAVGLVHAVQPALDDELAAAGLGRIGRAALGDVADPAPDLLRLAPRGRRRRPSPRPPSASAGSPASAASSSCPRRSGRGSRRSRRRRRAGRRRARPRPTPPRVLNVRAQVAGLDHRRADRVGSGAAMLTSCGLLPDAVASAPCTVQQHGSLSAQCRYSPEQE